MEAGGKYEKVKTVGSGREGHRVGENIHLVQKKNTNPSSKLVWAEVLRRYVCGDGQTLSQEIRKKSGSEEHYEKNPTSLHFW